MEKRHFNKPVKRIALLLMMLTMTVGSYASYDTKPCEVCKGLGYLRGAGVKVDCIACGGDGRVEVSAEEKHEIEVSAQEAVDFMNAFGLSPEDYAIYENLIRTAYQPVSDIRDCSACDGTGLCQNCGGVMNTSPDAPMCVCGNTGWCISCNGSGHIKWGTKDNPNKEELLMRAKEFLMGHSSSYHPDSDSESDYNSNSGSDFNPNSIEFNTFSVVRKGMAIIDIILYIVLAIAVIWFIVRIFKRK